jgi:hypothetical protein
MEEGSVPLTLTKKKETYPTLPKEGLKERIYNIIFLKSFPFGEI